MGFLEVLTLIFVTLKLTNYIDWSWWAVLSPTIFTLTLFLVLFVYLFLNAVHNGKPLNIRKRK